MNELLTDLIEDMQKSNGGHILYHYDDMDCYIQNAVSYITAGIRCGGHVLFVDNDRHYFHIDKELTNLLGKEELSRVHFMNNYDFYYSNGNFNPDTVFSFFLKNIQPYLDRSHKIFTWGLVEWGNVKDYIPLVEQYEKNIDKAIAQQGLISLCAYDNCSTPLELKESLLRCHDVLITDKEYKYL
ncbi:MULTISPECIES: MEDS domain-containing protein [unclassified Cytobacillus]|uniref:MEDS domain-containing protein n=1 Tax=unclassified Cytobacillus TaxID=2675268 RepID=UPI002041468A|nr:MEDS domain-containing protein [Cytobacillus sp. AMY 15.2]MCM3093162.1 MEDS domain-containing protein [Cytobacillus sp. AMY 15.2]